MPLDNLHMTALEVTHSRNAEEIASLVDILLPSASEISSTAAEPGKAPRLVKPMISFDTAAFALSFVPAAGEQVPQARTDISDRFTYHHFRRDLFSSITERGVHVDSRYVVPSAHVTIARFNTPNPFNVENALDGEEGFEKQKRQQLMSEIELINSWLEQEYWPKPDEDTDMGEGKATPRFIKPGGEWIVGHEKGLDFRRGTLWYGGGESIVLGKANASVV